MAELSKLPGVGTRPKIRRGRKAGPEPLAIGSLTASPCLEGIALALSAPLSGGSGHGYSYSIYRGDTPDFIVNEFSRLATVQNFPYLDRTAARGIHYFYGVVGADGDFNTVPVWPAGTGKWTGDYLPYVTAVGRRQALNIVFAGDSITYGLGVPNAGTVKLPTMPGFCITALRRRLGLGEIYGSNQGHSSHTLTDYAPGGSDYDMSFDRENPKSAVSKLRALHPQAQMVVSLMLGTNDSALEGSNNAPYEGCLTADQYAEKLEAIIDRILTVDAPDAMIFIHMPPYYTTNARTNFTYGPAGLAALMSYGEAIGAVVRRRALRWPDQVFDGDMRSFEYFAQNYRTEHLAQHFRGTTFYLHPSGLAGANGLIGTQSLGELHAAAIARAFEDE